MSKLRARPVSGFSLIELMVVITIVAILAALAAPSFDSLIESQRAKSAATDIYVALTRARSEALKRNANVTVTPKGGWAAGWQILDPATSAPIDDHDSIRNLAIAGPDAVTYQASGRLQGNTAPSFSITGNYPDSSRCVAVDLSGRPNLKRGSC
jgi:type IV fimbrial biogenesis protein FimT